MSEAECMYGASSLKVFCLVGQSDLLKPQSSCLFYIMLEKVICWPVARHTKTVLVCVCGEDGWWLD